MVHTASRQPLFRDGNDILLRVRVSGEGDTSRRSVTFIASRLSLWAVIFEMFAEANQLNLAGVSFVYKELVIDPYRYHYVGQIREMDYLQEATIEVLGL